MVFLLIPSPRVIHLMQASGNVAGLCNWAEAMCTYHNVAKVVEPKIEALRAAETQLKIATREKDAALEQLVVVQTKLDAMQASHTCVVTCSTQLPCPSA